MHGVAAAGDDHVAGAGRKFAAGEIDRGQRRGAGGINGEIHTAKVKAVRHAPRHDVQQNAGEAVFGPLGQMLQEPRLFVLEEFWQQRAEAVTDSQFRCSAAHAQNDASPLPQWIALGIARVIEPAWRTNSRANSCIGSMLSAPPAECRI